MRAVVLAAILLAPQAGQAQEWWQGIWAAEPDWCAQADQIGEVTPAPIAITVTEVMGYENTCSISAVQVMHGAGAVHMRLSCESEGSTYDEDQVVMRTDETGLAIWIWFGSGDPILFQRCD